MPEITGYHHVSLTVPDAGKSAAWYTQVLGFARLTGLEGDGFRKILLMHPASKTGFALTEHGARGSGDAFSEFRTGMDHLAFSVAGQASLEAWKARLDELGVAYSGIKPSAMGDVLVFRDPDNIQLEVYAPYSAR